MIKGIYISIFLLLILFLVSCTNLDSYVPIEKYDEVHLAYVEAKQDRTDLKNENKSLKTDIGNLENEVEKYKYLLSNLNELLSNVYYGYASNENWESDGFTAFSLEYGNTFYLITVGHTIHYQYDDVDTGLYTTIKFKQGSGDWIYPELLTYENDFNGNRDYAILYSDKITDGFEYDLDNSYPKFILGNTDNNILKEFNINNLIDGESGSPIIDLDGEVIEIATGNYVDINLVIEAIDNLE